MKKNNIVISIFSIVSLVFSSFASMTFANSVNPSEVNEILAIGQSLEVNKTVQTPAILPLVDVCLLEDETGSFADDIANLQIAAPTIYDDVVAVSPGAQFAVAGFRDYPVSPHGSLGDWVYRLLSGMSPLQVDWINGVNTLTAGGGGDIPEAQYDAIVSSAVGENNCMWRDLVANPGVQRILVVTTDAPFHLPGIGKPHVNTQASAILALNAQNIVVVGLKAPGAGGELDALAAATGGSVQPLSSDGSNIAQAIIDGLKELTTDIWFETECDDGLSVNLFPQVHYDVPGDTMVNFVETISVDNDVSLEGQTLGCVVTFIANKYPEEGVSIGRQKIQIHIPDTTAPEVSCIESVNPHGKKIPPAGNTTLPGNKGGMNEDGFYRLMAEDAVDGEIMVSVIDSESGVVFGPFVNGTNIKYTENGGTPKMKEMASVKNSEVDWHIFGNGDMIVSATDLSGNTSETTCYVPPLPKDVE